MAMPSSQRVERILSGPLLLGLLAVYGPALADVADRWMTDPKYSHGYFVPLFALWLLVRPEFPRDWSGSGFLAIPGLWLRNIWRSATAPSEGAGGFWWGLPVLGAGIALHLAGIFFYLDWVAEVSFLVSLFGLCVCAGGWRLARRAWPSIAFLVFMLPLPFQVEVALANPLQSLATEASVFLLQLFGFTAGAEGNTIDLNAGRLGVEEACSGLGMLVTFFALATAVALVLKRPLLDKCVIVASAIPIALIANLVRITATAVLLETVGDRVAMFVYHDLAGYLMMSLALALMWVELKLLSRLLVEVPREDPHSIDLGVGLPPAGAGRDRGERGKTVCV
jgi:exosortase